MKTSFEVVARVYNDDTGSRLEVCPDADGLGLFEICQYEGTKQVARIVFSKSEALQLINAIDLVTLKTVLGE